VQIISLVIQNSHTWGLPMQ